jgi:peptide/nickel transport system permease protein
MSLAEPTNINTELVAAHPLREMIRVYRGNKSALLGLLLFIFILLLTMVGPFIYRVDPFEMMGPPAIPMGESGFLLGTDYIGRDVLAEIIHGGKATLAVGAVAALATTILGTLFGSMAGYYGGRIDTYLMRVTELFQVIPAILLAMVIVALFTPTLMTIALAIGMASWPSVARLVRGEFLRIKKEEFVLAARSIGTGESYLIWMVILPNAIPTLLVAATLNIGTAILFEAALSYLGLGDPSVMSWGLIISNNREYVFDCWWAIAIPGLAIFITVLSISLIGDGLTDALNPKLREI